MRWIGRDRANPGIWNAPFAAIAGKRPVRQTHHRTVGTHPKVAVIAFEKSGDPVPGHPCRVLAIKRCKPDTVEANQTVGRC